MPQPSSIARLWRCAVVIFAMIAATELAIEAFHAPRALTLGVLSEPLFTGGFLLERGPTTFVVDAIPPRSPLAEAGVVPGDRLQWDEPIGRWYNVAAGERVSLTVIHGDARRKIEVTMPAARALPRHQVANYVMDFMVRLGGLVFGVIIGWRRPDLTAFRGFAAAGLLSAIPFPFSAPAAAHIGWLDFIASSSLDLALGALVLFAINYPDDKPVGWRAILKRYYPWFFGLQIAVELFYFARLYDGFFEPATRWFFRACSVGIPTLFLTTIVLGWRQARGELRVRFQWILATLGAVIAPVLINTLNYLTGEPIPVEDMTLVLGVSQVAGMLGLVYAIARRRIFDFGLAVNRTLVFAIVGAILLLVFQIAHGIVSEFLHFDDKNKTILLSAILAVAVYLSFNNLKKRVEKIVDRLFFKSWAASEDGLRRFVKEARYASSAGALAKSLVAALDRFTQGAGCAVYQRRAGESYLRTEGTLEGAPEHVDANDETVLAMRAHDNALRIRESSRSLRAALALPMAHRGELFGFALLGAMPGGDPYRPDQIDLLQFAAHQVGLDFYALKIEQLEREIAVERQTSETLRAQLQTAIEIANVRSVERPS